ncbi:MAG: cation:proton antiporter [Gammaproteobacteria bacterium]
MDFQLSIIELVTIFTCLLGIGALMLAFSNRFRVPFTIILVLVGVLLSSAHIYGPQTLHSLVTMKISPDLIYYICLPTLIFESAYNLNSSILRQNMIAVLALAIPGLLISTIFIGAIVYWMTSIPFIYCLLLGAILSSTDPVAVVSIFKKLGAPKRLTVLVEGESLFNDATAIVTSHIILTIILAGVFTSHQIYHGIFAFGKEFLGGLFVGYLTALIAGYFLSKVKNNPEIEISITTILAYATFLVAQNVFHVSGVTATVSAGLMISVWGDTKISPEVVKFMGNFWEFLAYVTNTIIFLIVGISVNISELITHKWAIFSVIVAILIGRAIVMYGFIPLVRKIPRQPYIDWRYQTVMYWGGLRGAIALAIVLSLGAFEYSDLFLATVLGTVLFTLIVQGLTIEKLVKSLGLSLPSMAEQLARLESALYVKKKTEKDILELQKEGMFSARISDDLLLQNKKEMEEVKEEIGKFKVEKIKGKDELTYLLLDCLGIQRNLYYDLFAKGHFAERTYRRLIETVVAQFDAVRAGNFQKDYVNPFPSRKYYVTKVLNVFESSPLFDLIARRYNVGRVALNYKVAWGLMQGTKAAIKHIKMLEIAEHKDFELLKQVEEYFQYSHDLAKKRLDAIAEQFPEFVLDMQERLAQRLVLHEEVEGLDHQIASGIIPSESAKMMKARLIQKIRDISEQPDTHIIVSGEDHYRQNQLLATLPEDEFAIITQRLNVRAYPLDDVLIEENEKSDTIYFIVRGVVRLSKRIGDEEKEIATLLAGDTCGLISTESHEKYPVTCRTVTPCALAKLSLRDFEKIKSTCPKFVEEIKKATQERKLLLQKTS